MSLETVARSPSIVPAATRCNVSSPALQRKLIGIVLSLHPQGHRKWLQRVTKRSPRTCDYWLAGETDMGGDAFMAITGALRAEIEGASRELQQFELDLR